LYINILQIQHLQIKNAQAIEKPTVLSVLKD